MLGKTLLPSDAELGKKDDDHRYAPARRSGWSTWIPAFRWRRRRVLVVLIGLILVYIFVWNAPSPLEELEWDQKLPPHQSPHIGSRKTYQESRTADDDDDNDEPTGPPPGQSLTHNDIKLRNYDGPIRFFRLGDSLREQATVSSGYMSQNRNVLFAISSLKSASTLLPLICEMATWKRNRVHAVFMGREDIPLENILEINGVDNTTCVASWHDARPDYVEYSTDTRAESAVSGALTHIRKYLHPQVAITDDLEIEDSIFARAVRSETDLLDIPLIQIPKGKAEDLTWITRLDTGSLRMWHEPAIDIVIQVSPHSSNVLRLLRSMIQADYSGLKPPHITLEVPAQLDDSVRQHLEDIEWPPRQNSGLAGSGLTMRRRITAQRATQEDSAIRFFELYYPTDTSFSHVLVLSPETQLSPQYYQFIMYTLLEYKYSSFVQVDNQNLMGISLELPFTLLDGKTELVLPQIKDMHATRYLQLYSNTRSAPFLRQAPNSHATLYFGSKWAEMHSFLSNRVLKHHQSPEAVPRPKIVSETLPSWTEYMLEFMRVRGYSLLYPAFMSNALVTVHSELWRAPEEFSAEAQKSAGSATSSEGPKEAFLRADNPRSLRKVSETPISLSSAPLHLALPFDGDLPEIPQLPQLLYNGAIIDPNNVSSVAGEVAAKFRANIGGCQIPKGKHKRVVAGETGDLFCFGDGDEADLEDDFGLLSDDDLDKTEIHSWLNGLYNRHGVGGSSSKSNSSSRALQAHVKTATAPVASPSHNV